MTLAIGIYPEPFLRLAQTFAVAVRTYGQTIFFNPLFTPMVVMLVIIALFPLVAGYIVLVERKVLADFQVRLGPMRVGPHGLLQPIADALKLLLKEDIIPTDSDKAIFWFAPVHLHLHGADRLCRAAVRQEHLRRRCERRTAGDFRGVGGGHSGDHSGRLGLEQPLSAAGRAAQRGATGELRSGAVLRAALRRDGGRNAQHAGHHSGAAETAASGSSSRNYGFMIVPFVVYIIAATAETNRAPFDLPEAESELVAGFHTEYSGFRWALYFLAEYANIFVVSSVAVTLFWGGWLRPFPSVGWLDIPLNMAFPVVLFAGSGLLTLHAGEEAQGPDAAEGAGGRGPAADSGGSGLSVPVDQRGRSAACSGFCSRSR